MAAELNESPEAIEARMSRRYMERMALKLRSFRKMLAERQWEALRDECEQLAPTARAHGLTALAELAQQVLDAIPPGKISKVAYLPHARDAVAQLITAMDRAV